MENNGWPEVTRYCAARDHRHVVSSLMTIDHLVNHQLWDIYLWSVVCGQWSVVSGQRSVVSSQLSVVVKGNREGMSHKM